MKSIFQFSINYIYENSDYILFGYSDGFSICYLNILKFSSNNLDNSPIYKSQAIELVFGEAVSCCLTEEKNIMCIFIHENGYIYIMVYSLNLDFITNLNLGYKNVNKGNFSLWEF